jgi:hypothetical protein
VGEQEPINGEDKKWTYKRICTEMIDVMVANVSDRFCDIPELKFLCLLDPKHFANYHRNFPIEALNCLMEIYSTRFDPVRLKSELVALYCDAEFHRNVNELHKYIPSNIQVSQTHPYNTSYKCIDRTVVFCSQKNKKLSAQHPGPTTTIILVTVEHRKSSAG